MHTASHSHVGLSGVHITVTDWKIGNIIRQNPERGRWQRVITTLQTYANSQGIVASGPVVERGAKFFPPVQICVAGAFFAESDSGE